MFYKKLVKHEVAETTCLTNSRKQIESLDSGIINILNFEQKQDHTVGGEYSLAII